MIKICKCGHSPEDHHRATGPNSIGQHWFGQCANGWKIIGPYLLEGESHCRCDGYRTAVFRSVLNSVVECLNSRRYPC